LWQALSTRNYDIPNALHANLDQQQTKYQLGAELTWAPSGLKQVAMVGQEEKCTFTLMVAVSASGELLPFQSVWDGKTGRFLPKLPKDIAEEAKCLGFKCVASGTDNYWSMFNTMCDYVKNILVPYFGCQKTWLSLQMDHKCIFQIDVWSVHKSVAF
jgi:hypothetical protein